MTDVILNEDLQFESVEPTVKRAFLRVPEKTLLTRTFGCTSGHPGR